VLLLLARWVQSTAFFTLLRTERWPYPIVLSLHMVALSFFGGMILLTDLRLLGLAMRDRTMGDVVDQLRVPKRVGFAVMLTLGLLLLGCKAEEYYYNPFFRAKVLLLGCVGVHAMVFRSSVYCPDPASPAWGAASVISTLRSGYTSDCSRRKGVI